MPGHGGRTVVHDDHGPLTLVVHHIQQGRNTGMKKRAVTNGAHRRFREIRFPHTMQHPDAGAHRAHGMLGIEGRQGAQDIASNVSGYRQLHFVQQIKCAAVRTAGT